MKTIKNTPSNRMMSLSRLSRVTALIAGIALTSLSAHGATNLLVNGDFNAGSAGWSTFAYGGGWASFEIPGKLTGTTPTTWPSGWPQGAGTNAAGTGPLYDGTTQLTCGGYNNAGGFAWQIIAATPGVEYTLILQAGAENWWLPAGEARLIWQGEGDVEITRNVVDTCCAIRGSCSGASDMYDVGVPYQYFTNSAVAPVGTKSLKIELCNGTGTGSAWFDNAVLTSPQDPPILSGVYPDGGKLLQNTNKLVFNASSKTPINNSGVKLVINGSDVSSSLTFTGPSTNLVVSYTGLQSNRVYNAVITVSDVAGLTTFRNLEFDTFTPVFSWEAEDYDFGSGQFINNPVPTTSPAAGSYFDMIGTPEVDFHERASNGNHNYRAADGMATSVSGDKPRQSYLDAAVNDYNVGWFDPGGFADGDNVGIGGYKAAEWVNYTRTMPAGKYNIYGRLSNGDGATATVNMGKVVSGQGTTEQVVEALGSFRFPGNGWDSYAFAPLTDRFGNRVAVDLLGDTTLRVTASSGANLNFFFLVPADSELPTITGVYPNGATLIQGTNKMKFVANSANHSIAQSDVSLTLNGVDVSSSLSFAGNSKGWEVTAPLGLNTTNYTAVIRIADDVGNVRSTTLYFDTFDTSSYVVEAENFDFAGGQFIDHPVVTSFAAENSYFDRAGVDNVDSFVGDTAPPPTADFRFRSQADAVATSTCTDTPTRELVAARLTNAMAFNYNVSWWSTNAWLNYSHTYPTGSFKVYGRLAGENNGAYAIRLDKVSGGTSAYLGTFVGTGRGYNAFDWVPMISTNSGQVVTVELGGVATLRTTTLRGNVNPNSYLLVPIQAAPEDLGWNYSAAGLTFTWANPALHLQVQTNAPGAGLKGVWYDYPGGASSGVTVPVNTSSGSLFFRLSN